MQKVKSRKQLADVKASLDILEEKYKLKNNNIKKKGIKKPKLLEEEYLSNLKNTITGYVKKVNIKKNKNISI